MFKNLLESLNGKKAKERHSNLLGFLLVVFSIWAAFAGEVPIGACAYLLTNYHYFWYLLLALYFFQNSRRLQNSKISNSSIVLDDIYRHRITALLSTQRCPSQIEKFHICANDLYFRCNGLVGSSLRVIFLQCLERKPK